MSAEVPYGEPIELLAGDTYKFLKTLSDYSIADGWALKYRMVVGATTLAKTASDNGDGNWLVTIDKADLAGILADTTARLYGWVEKAGERWSVYDDYVRVKPNLETANATQLKTHEVRTLEAIEAVIEERATADLEQYTLNGRSVTKVPIEQLLKWRGTYRAIVWRQQNPGVAMPQQHMRFTEAR